MVRIELNSTDTNTQLLRGLSVNMAAKVSSAPIFFCMIISVLSLRNVLKSVSNDFDG